jgi:PAS domain-containing protein
MNQQEIEVILARQLADYLALPIFLVDQAGQLLFYNEPAEKILGHRFEETGPMPAEEWATIFRPTDEDDRPLPPEQLPLMIALRAGRPAHSGFWIRGLDGVLRQIYVTAVPLLGQANRRLGAFAIFWEAGT